MQIRDISESQENNNAQRVMYPKNKKKTKKNMAAVKQRLMCHNFFSQARMKSVHKIVRICLEIEARCSIVS